MADKLIRIMLNMMDVVCANDKNDFAILDDGDQCPASTEAEMGHCYEKAKYSLAKRLMEKWIENEQFEYDMNAEDCK